MQKDRLTHALTMCKAWHEGQVRKYTGEPYWNHPVHVMEIVKSVPHTEEMLLAALLHDVVEDTECTLQAITNAMGEEVAELVNMVTNIAVADDGNRRERMLINMAHLAGASPKGKTVKLADIISNLANLYELDPKFAEVYVSEKEAVLDVLREGDSDLWQQAKNIINEIKDKIKMEKDNDNK